MPDSGVDKGGLGRMTGRHDTARHARRVRNVISQRSQARARVPDADRLFRGVENETLGLRHRATAAAIITTTLCSTKPKRPTPNHGAWRRRCTAFRRMNHTRHADIELIYGTDIRLTA